ncbi:MAG: flagellar biosynthesis protein FliQ [Treponema sp.]|nr:flagellar biosynthesis protein FliQ [Treponema sp.]
MGINTVLNLMQQGIIQFFKLATPVLGAALLIGLVVAIFQATTSIQEQTLTFLPKLLTILLVLALLGGWMFTSMGQYVRNIFNMIPGLAA